MQMEIFNEVVGMKNRLTLSGGKETVSLYF